MSELNALLRGDWGEARKFGNIHIYNNEYVSIIDLLF